MLLLTSFTWTYPCMLLPLLHLLHHALEWRMGERRSGACTSSVIEERSCAFFASGAKRSPSLSSLYLLLLLMLLVGITKAQSSWRGCWNELLLGLGLVQLKSRWCFWPGCGYRSTHTLRFPHCCWEIISFPFLHVMWTLLILLTEESEETAWLWKCFQPDIRNALNWRLHLIYGGNSWQEEREGA